MGRSGRSAAFFFCLLCGYYLLRPVRESMGLRGGVRQLEYLYLGTLTLTVLLQPLLARGLRTRGRARLLPWLYRLFQLMLLGFAALIQFAPEAWMVGVGRLYYVWLSAFNLCVVSLFWSWMADLHTTEAGKRTYGWIGAGGTLGAVIGSMFAEQLSTRVGEAVLLVLGAAFLEGALWLAKAARAAAATPEVDSGAVRSTGGDEHPSPARDPVVALDATGPSEEEKRASWSEGFRRVWRSGYLRHVAAYLFLMTFLATFAYFVQANLVADASLDPERRTALFAGINKWTNALTLVLQLFVTRAWLSRLGLGAALTALPAINLAGFAALALKPSLATLIVFQVVRRGTNYALARPARELLFTKVDGVTRYQAKNLIDSFLYRGGDAIGAAVFGRLSSTLALGLAAIAWIAVPIAGFWMVLGWWLGKREPEHSIEVDRTGLSKDDST